MDNYETSLVLVDLDAGNGETGYFSNADYEVVYGVNTYTSVPEASFDIEPITGDFSNQETTIKNLPNTLDVVAGLAFNLPYMKVAVTIREVFYDLDGIEGRTEYLFKGFVYQSESKPGKGIVDLILRSIKYYTDTTAGTPCTEACSNRLGDAVCGVLRHSETHSVASISRNDLTITGPLVDTTPLLFNKGFIQLGAQYIDIKYHDTGLTFNMDRPVPSSWVGQVVEIYAGCDRSIDTCRSIHNNEENFRGLGIAMVDYQPLYETN